MFQRRSLIFIVVASALIYLLVFSLPFPLSQHYRTVPPVDYAKLTDYSVIGFVEYLAGLTILFGLYAWALWLAWPGRRNPQGFRASEGRWVLMVSVGLAAILFLSYPLTAIDMLVYALRTRGWALYGVNPLALAPAQWPGSDPWLGLAAEWVNTPSPYGPVWEVLSLSAYYLSGGAVLNHLLAIKLITTGAYLGSAVLIYLTLRQSKPEWAVAGTLAFAWNPLVLLESVQNAHNDIVMVFFLAAAIWALQHTLASCEHSERSRAESKNATRGRERSAAGNAGRWLYPLLVCLFLALSILTKFVTALVAPFFLLALISGHQTWKSRLVWLFGYTLFIGGMVVVGMWPLWPGWDTWAVLNSGDAAGRSIVALLILALRELIGGEAAFAVVEKCSQGMFVLIYGYTAWRVSKLFRQRAALARGEGDLDPSQGFQQVLASSFLVLFWYVLLVAPVFHAWYLLWFWPLAVLVLPQRRPLDATIVFSITALFVIPYFETIRVWYPVLLRNPLLGHVIGVSLLATPPIITLLWPKKPATAPAG